MNDKIKGKEFEFAIATLEEMVMFQDSLIEELKEERKKLQEELRITEEQNAALYNALWDKRLEIKELEGKLLGICAENLEEVLEEIKNKGE